jgi:hypothetical protein
MSAEELAMSFTGKHYDACTKQDKERIAIAIKWIEEDYKGDGLLGCLIELFACSEKSPKMQVSAQGKADSRIRFRNSNGNIDYIPIEVKTNGGRVAHMSGAYTVYCLAFTQKYKPSKANNWQGAEERRIIKPVVIPTKLFLNYLYNNGIVKSTNGKQPEPAIQCSSKKLYEALQAWPIPYDRTKTYCADDFEDLSL